MSGLLASVDGAGGDLNTDDCETVIHVRKEEKPLVVHDVANDLLDDGVCQS